MKRENKQKVAKFVEERSYSIVNCGRVRTSGTGRKKKEDVTQTKAAGFRNVLKKYLRQKTPTVPGDGSEEFMVHIELLCLKLCSYVCEGKHWSRVTGHHTD